jgi:hypothetical protein
MKLVGRNIKDVGNAKAPLILTMQYIATNTKYMFKIYITAEQHQLLKYVCLSI